MLQQTITRFFAAIGLIATAAGAVCAGMYLRHLQTPSVLAAVLGSAAGQSSSQQTPAPNAADLPPMGTWMDGPVQINYTSTPIKIVNYTTNDIPFILVEGGTVGSRRSMHRQGVSDFVRDANAAAGLNGTFFANASMNGTDNGLIGPSLCGDEPAITIGPYDQRPNLVGRPLVLMSPSSMMITPYDPATMDDENSLRSLLPGVTDIFLSGVWLVHDGVAASKARLASYHVLDCNDPRRRAFFAIMADGRPALGATECSTTSRLLGRALAASGVREAVLLDSGFSTSLICGDKILVTGHTAPGVPSRIVPHSLLLFGDYETATGSADATSAPAPASPNG